MARRVPRATARSLVARVRISDERVRTSDGWPGPGHAPATPRASGAGQRGGPRGYGARVYATVTVALARTWTSWRAVTGADQVGPAGPTAVARGGDHTISA